MIACTSWHLLCEQSLLQQPLHRLLGCSKALYRLRCLKESYHSQLLMHCCQRIQKACALTLQFSSRPHSCLHHPRTNLSSQQPNQAVLHLQSLVTDQLLYHRCIPDQPHCLCHFLALKVRLQSCGSVSMKDRDPSIKMTDHCLMRHLCFFWAVHEMKFRRQCRFNFEGSLCRQHPGRCLYDYLKICQRRVNPTFWISHVLASKCQLQSHTLGILGYDF